LWRRAILKTGKSVRDDEGVYAPQTLGDEREGPATMPILGKKGTMNELRRVQERRACNLGRGHRGFLRGRIVKIQVSGKVKKWI